MLNLKIRDDPEDKFSSAIMVLVSCLIVACVFMVRDIARVGHAADSLPQLSKTDLLAARVDQGEQYVLQNKLAAVYAPCDSQASKEYGPEQKKRQADHAEFIRHVVAVYHVDMERNHIDLDSGYIVPNAPPSEASK